MVARGVVQVETARRPAFDLLFFLLGLLVPELPAVLDLRQELANSLDIALAPIMHPHTAESHSLRCRHFLRRNIPA